MPRAAAELAVRDWATRAVQWDPARTALKRGVMRYAAARGLTMEKAGRLPAVANVYSASSPKAGSQWMKALFTHPVVRAHSRLFTLPQLNFVPNLDTGFPLATFVPGLYVSHEEYQRIPHRHPHRVVYMFRDPRDIVVSGYFSARGTGHRVIPSQEAARARLRELPQDEGLLYAVELAASRLQEMATWVDAEEPEVGLFKLEEVDADPRVQVHAILRHAGIELPAGELETVLMDVSREAVQRKDMAMRGDASQTHYRVDRKTFRELFDERHYAAVEAVVPGLAQRLGYPS